MKATGKGGAKVVKLNPGQQNGQPKVIHASLRVLIPGKAELTNQEAARLSVIFGLISVVNRALPGFIARWVTRNNVEFVRVMNEYNKKIQAWKDKYYANPDDTDLNRGYVERGNPPVVWNEDKTEVISGDRMVWSGDRDERGNPANYFSSYTKKPFDRTVKKSYIYELKDEALREECEAEEKALNEEKYPVSILAIYSEVSDELTIPTSHSNGNPVDNTLLYQYFIVEEEAEQNEN
jgi:hypothetical protein